MGNKMANYIVIALIVIIIIGLGYSIIRHSPAGHGNAQNQSSVSPNTTENDKSSFYKNTIEKTKNTVDTVNKVNEQAKDLLPGNQN